MQLVFIIAFGLLLSLPSRGLFEPIWPDVAATLVGALLLAFAVPVGVGLASRLCLWRLGKPDGFSQATSTFGKVQLGLRVGLLSGLALLLTETSWMRLVRYDWGLGRWPLVDELVLVSPLLAGSVLAWLAMYPTDRALRIAASVGLGPAGRPIRDVWSLPQYMEFQVRHQVLTVLVPMSLIVLAYDVVTQNRAALQDLTGVAWGGDALVAVTAGVVFVTAPAMLRRIWSTQRMEPSGLRIRLERVCRRLQLRYRDILVWQSHGVMVNAAVMGLLPRLRYILLSDGLLENLNEDQIEAVFGHEAGHVKEHHISYYILFAVASMLMVGVVVYWFEAIGAVRPQDIELAAAGMIALIWGVAFGWISRRFERQADIYGVRCLGETIQLCHLPCWQHNMTPPAPADKPICSTAAGLFASALEVVAAMNGISKHARSWRHSSIASRQAFLKRAAFQPHALTRFEQTIIKIKRALICATIALACLVAWLYWPQLVPRRREPRYRLSPPVVVRAEPENRHPAMISWHFPQTMMASGVMKCAAQPKPARKMCWLRHRASPRRLPRRRHPPTNPKQSGEHILIVGLIIS